MKRIMVVALVFLCGNGYARTYVDVNIGFPVYCERPVYYVPVYYPPPPPPVFYEARYCRPAPVYVEYRDYRHEDRRDNYHDRHHDRGAGQYWH